MKRRIIAVTCVSIEQHSSVQIQFKDRSAAYAKRLCLSQQKMNAEVGGISRDREALLNSYKENVEYIDSVLDSDTTLSEVHRAELNDWRDLLMIYINSGTIESDYLNEELIDVRPIGMENSAFKFAKQDL